MAKIEYERIEYADGEISYHKFVHKLRVNGKSTQKMRLSGFCFRLPTESYISRPTKTTVTKEEYDEAYKKRVIWKDEENQ